MTPTERERIEKEAAVLFNECSIISQGDYISGAVAEHDKARNQAIQDCIDIVSVTPGDENVIPKLEKLKAGTGPISSK